MAVFTNQATLSYNNITVNSNTVTGEILDVLAVDKNAVRGVYSVGDIVTYVVSIVNTSETPFESLTLTDDLGAYTFGEQTLVPLTYLDGTVQYYVNGTLAPALTVTSENPLTLDGLNIPAGANALVIYSARVNSFAPPAADGEIVNTASVNACGGEASETITALSEPQLAVEKGITPASVGCGGTVTYTFTIRNYGNADAVATDNVVLSDAFDPALSDLTVTLDGAAFTAYTYNEETGEFSTASGAITVPAATYTQDPVTGAYSVNPGAATVTVTGTV